MASHTALTATEWNELHTVVQEPPKLKSHFAQMILELTGDYAKAVRADQCGLHARVKAKDGCTQTICYHCMLGFCDYCAGKVADDLLKAWHGALTQAIRDARSRKFTLVTVLQPFEANTETLRKWFSEATVPDAQDVPHFKRMRGHIGGAVDLRILYLGSNPTINQWQKQFPGAAVKVWYFGVDQLHKVFREQLLETYIPKDGRERARQEVLFNGVHRFSATGIKKPKKAAPKIADSEEGSANLPPDNLNCGLGKCRHGYYFNERTEWFIASEMIPPEGWVKYQRVPPLPIQH